MSLTEDQRAYQREWRRRARAKNPEKYRAEYRVWRTKNPGYCFLRHKKWVENNPIQSLLNSVRTRAKRAGITFDLTINDLIIPGVCPVLGIPISFGDMKGRSNSPSVDRFDNAKGYTKDNIRIISYRANHLKSDGTLAEMEKVLRYMRGQP